jgi:hypothetical protein
MVIRTLEEQFRDDRAGLEPSSATGVTQRLLGKGFRTADGEDRVGDP